MKLKQDKQISTGQGLVLIAVHFIIIDLQAVDECRVPDISYRTMNHQDASCKYLSSAQPHLPIFWYSDWQHMALLSVHGSYIHSTIIASTEIDSINVRAACLPFAVTMLFASAIPYTSKNYSNTCHGYMRHYLVSNFDIGVLYVVCTTYLLACAVEELTNKSWLQYFTALLCDQKAY